MFDDDLCCVMPQIRPVEEPDAATLNVMQDTMNAKLTDIDRRAVDFLLGGEEAALENDSPMARNAFMERVQAVQRVLSLLDAMPPEAPSTRLVDATLARTPFMDPASDSSGEQPAA